MATDVEILAGGAVATLRFVSDAKVNLLSVATLESLERQIVALSAEPEIRVWILTGTGPSFLAGADVKELAALPGPAEAERVSRLGSAVLSRLADADAITIAAINGAAMGGGCELALACDLRVMSREARIGLVEVGLGVIPGWGGTQRLSRLVGVGRAMQMVLTAEVLGAAEALAIGLANQLAPPGGVEASARGLGDQLVAQGPTALRLAKRAVRGGLDRPLVEGLELETRLFGQCFESDEAQEGLKTFIEKRKPRWRK